VELPFAGHPTVGAAVALAATGRIPLAEGLGSCVLAERIGQVAVEVSQPVDAPASALLTTPRRSELIRSVHRDDAASMLGIDPAALHPDLAPSAWSAGVEFAIIVVRDLDALGSVRPSPTAAHVYAVCPDGDGDEERDALAWQARMFAPAMGITEDPATGAAAAAFSGYLASLDPIAEPTRRWTIRQGVEMGRPSRIDVVVHRDADRQVTTTQIGGSALIVGSGSLVRPNGEMLEE
jgi:trans-2,3-dihydro-3-hydroxyanthranilate isomerase